MWDPPPHDEEVADDDDKNHRLALHYYHPCMVAPTVTNDGTLIFRYLIEGATEIDTAGDSGVGCH